MGDLTNEQKVDTLIERVLGGETLRKVSVELFGNYQNFNTLVSGVRELNLRYTNAMLLRADLLADEILDIADSGGDPAQSKNRIDARKWLASKIMPSRYGDRLEVVGHQTISINEALTDARARMIIDVEPVQPTIGSSAEPDIFS